MNDSVGQLVQINSLEHGKGLQYLLNESYKILGNPFVLFDMEYKLIACTEGIVTDDPIWNEIVETNGFSNESIAFFKEEDFTDTAANTKSIALLSSSKLKYERLYGRIFNSDNSTVADLIMMACDKPLVTQDSIVFEALCQKISKEISDSEYYWQYGVIYHETLICQLLGKDIGDKIIYSDHVANLYEGLKANLYLAVADISKCNSENSNLDTFRDLFKRTQAEFKYAVFSDYILALISTDDTDLIVDKDLSRLCSLFELNNIYAGISSRFDNLFDLQKHYREAVDALKLGLESNCHQRVFLYDDSNAN